MQLEFIQTLVSSINSINLNLSNEKINLKDIYSCSRHLILIEKLEQEDENILKFVEDTSILVAELNAIINTEEIKNNTKLINNIKRDFKSIFNRVMEPINNTLDELFIDELLEV